MKVALRNIDSFSCLDVSGEVDAHNFSVIKAGLSKLLGNGKNKIALNLLDGGKIESSVVRELAILDVFARELSGQIVLVSSDKELRESVLSFAKPPVIPIVDSIESATEFFKKSSQEESLPDLDKIASLKKEIERKNREIDALKARLASLDGSSVKKVSQKAAELESIVKDQKIEIQELIKQLRKPASVDGLLEKVASLEQALENAGQAKQ